MKNELLILSMFSVCAVMGVKAQGTFTSNNIPGPNAWSNSASWNLTSGTDADGIPDADDNVTVVTADTIDISTNRSCNNLTVNGTIRWTVNNIDLIVQGNLITNTCTLGSSSVTVNNNDSLIVNGNWSVPASTTTTIGATNGITLSMPANTLTITGTLSLVKLAGFVSKVQTLNNITIASGGAWNCNPLAQAFNIKGDLIHNGNTITSFLSGNGKYYLTGTNKIIGGSQQINFAGELICDGSYTNYNTSDAKGVIVKRFSGEGSFTQGANSFLTLQTRAGDNYDDFSLATFNASTPTNMVIYKAIDTVAQTVRLPDDNSYSTLQLLSCNAIFPSVMNIDDQLILVIDDYLTSTDNNYIINLKGDWNNSAGSGKFLPLTGTVNLNGTGTQTINNTRGNDFYTLMCSGSGTKKLLHNTTLTNLIVNSGSTFDVNTSPSFTLTLAGNFTNSGTFLPQTSKVVFNGTTAQTIGGTTDTRFYNIEIDNLTGGVSLDSNESITHTLKLINGTFTTNNHNFTLISDPTTLKTARVDFIPATASIVGPIVMQRYLPATLKTDWRLITAPANATIAQWTDDFPTAGFTGATYDPNNTSNFCSIQTYNEAYAGHLDSGFVNITADTDPITPGKGFSVYLGNSMAGQTFTSPITIDVKGTPGQQDVTVPLTYTNSSATAWDNGWNLVGNPYPSDIDWDASGGIDTAGTGVSSMYIYNPAISGHISYVGGVSVPSVANARYISSSSAFWVKATSSGNLVFHESAKVDTNRAFYQPVAVSKSNPEVLRLTVTGNGKQDETAIRAKSDATMGFDTNYDAYKMNVSSGSPAISTLINGGDMVINTIPLIGNVALSVKVKVPVTGTYVIAKGAGSTWSLSSCTILEDLLTGIKTDLRSSSYSFTIADTTKAPRFLLHLSEGANKSSVAVTCFGKSDGKATAQGIGNGPFTYVWKNSKGDVLRTTANVTTADQLDNLVAGIYTVEIKGGSPVCGDITDTIAVTQPKELTAEFAVERVNCSGGNTGVIVAKFNGGTTPYTYKWSNNATTATIKDLATGEYTVTVTDAHQCTAVGAATVKAAAAVTAAFTPSATTIYLVEDNGKVTFKNETKATATYTWNFGDDTDISDLANPEHVYKQVGVYNVLLIAKTEDCRDTAYAEITVKFNKASQIVELATGRKVEIGLLNSNQAFVKFDYTESNNAVITVQNVLGQDISKAVTVTPKNQTVYLDLANVNSKVVLITVTTNYGRVSKTVVK